MTWRKSLTIGKYETVLDEYMHYIICRVSNFLYKIQLSSICGTHKMLHRVTNTLPSAEMSSDAHQWAQ